MTHFPGMLGFGAGYSISNWNIDLYMQTPYKAVSKGHLQQIGYERRYENRIPRVSDHVISLSVNYRFTFGKKNINSITRLYKIRISQPYQAIKTKQMNLQEIEIRPFSTSSLHETFLMEVSGRFFEIGKDVAELLTYFKCNGCEEASIEEYSKQNGKFSKEEILTFLNDFAKKLEKESELPNKRKSFLYNRELISANVINKCSSLLAPLFNKWFILFVILFFIALDVLYFIEYSTIGKEHLNLNIYILSGLLFFFILSSLFHELGHASACRYFDISHGGIGLGLYINIPVFYTDVSSVWKLPRKKRCIVNVGGVYFQILLLIPFLVIYLYSQSSLLSYIILIMNFNFLLTLNPFFKFDGYWIMTDVLGVANLRQKGKEWMLYMINKFRHKNTNKVPYLMSLSKGTKIALVIYTIVVNFFFGFYFLYILPLFFY